MKWFDEIADKLNATFSDWFQVVDEKSLWTMDNVNIIDGIGVDAEQVKPHCVDCVMINQCWFKNETNKKPEEFDYSNTTLIPEKDRGLYHPFCHCKKVAIDSPTPDQIIVFNLERKMDYLFNDKKDWLDAMGYNEQDKEEVFHLLESLSKEEYCKGNYINNPPQDESKKNYGYRIRVNLDFPGKREKSGRIFKIRSSYMVYPNGKLKNNTPIGGKIK